ncbi:DUF3147 family protein [Marispirochaeta sp.]|jgi:hypothetical protein|uniref:DUF3147 family protein n=1 Tax=Marispirochaeta sp. TaxID=2038653 RepID=UPI0029C6F46C|nr:DUF3147 family protein [Marispirochaeta sp.]
MAYYLVKLLISALIVVLVSEIAKRSSLLGALIASLPLTSLLALIWMRVEKVESQRIAAFSSSIFWLVLPSLLFFIVLPLLLRRNIPFWLGISIACGITALSYILLTSILRYFHIEL